MISASELEDHVTTSIKNWCGSPPPSEDIYNPYANDSVRLTEYITSVLREPVNESVHINSTQDLISVEGLDASGKTSAVNTVSETVPGNVHLTTEPNDTAWTGTLVRNAICTEGVHPIAVLYFFMLDHKVHVQTVVKPQLRQNNVVVSDRYLDSRIAYQSISLSKYFETENEAIQTLIYMHQNVDWSLFPEKTIFLDASADTVMERLSQNRDEEEKEIFEKAQFMENVYDSYNTLISLDTSSRFVQVDAEKPIETVKDNIQNVIQSQKYLICRQTNSLS